MRVGGGTRTLTHRYSGLADTRPLGELHRRSLTRHGEASPHNLLVPKHQPDTFVVIDWAMPSLAAAGDDLGQLLIGHAHDGVLAADDLPALHELPVHADVAGLADEDCRLDEDVVRAGVRNSRTVRAAAVHRAAAGTPR